MDNRSHCFDLQVNGYRNIDFSSPTLTCEDIERTADTLHAAGTGLFLPTLITCPVSVYKKNLMLFNRCLQKSDLAKRMPGIHLEGPFLSRAQGARGVHNPACMKKADTDVFDRLQDFAGGHIRLCTIAADIDGAEKLTAHAVRNKVAVALGHQMANEQQLRRCTDAGATLLTHFGNGLPHTIHRHDNPLWAGLAIDELTAMIITDGHHIPPSLIKTILRVKSPRRVIVTSDSSPLAGMQPGRYKCMGKNVLLEKNGRLRDLSSGYLAGSAATMGQCIDYLASLDLLSKQDIRTVAIDNPRHAIL